MKDGTMTRHIRCQPTPRESDSKVGMRAITLFAITIRTSLRRVESVMAVYRTASQNRARGSELPRPRRLLHCRRNLREAGYFPVWQPRQAVCEAFVSIQLFAFFAYAVPGSSFKTC